MSALFVSATPKFTSASDILGDAQAQALFQSRYPKFASLLQIGATPAVALRYLGLALWQDGAFDAAAQVMRRNVQAHPDEPDLLSELGSVLLAKGDKQEAMQCLVQSLTANPAQAMAWLNLATLCKDFGNLEMAEHAFRAVLDLEPSSADAATGLGLLCMEQRRFEESVVCLTGAIAKGANAMGVFACLGQSHYMLANFSAAAHAFEEALKIAPDQEALLKKRSYSRALEAFLDKSVAEATAVYDHLAGPTADPIPDMLRSVFQILTGYGHTDAALRVGHHLLDLKPGDPIITYHVDALLGRPHTRAPDAYVAACFNKYAAKFDTHLVQVLEYAIPEKCAALLTDLQITAHRILDLGCGTGLAAPFLSTYTSNIIGVDLAPRMLDEARKVNLYADLVEAEAVAYLGQDTSPFDLITALDVLVYFGDLSELFAGVAHRLRKDGIFAFCYELGGPQDYRFLTSGRYAHAPDYVARLSAAHFAVRADLETTLRLEVNKPIVARLVVLQRV